MNLLDATVAGSNGKAVTLQLVGQSTLNVTSDAKVANGQKVTVGIRPESLGISASGTIAGKIAVIERLGGETLCYVDIGNKILVTIKVSNEAIVEIDQPVTLAVTSGSSILFNDVGMSFRHKGS